MGGRKRKSGRVKAAEPAPRPSAMQPQVEMQAGTAADILTRHLQGYVAEHGLKAKTKEERDRVRIELQDRALEMFVLPEESRERLKELLRIRILIIDNKERAMRIGRTNVKETIAVFEELRKWLTDYPHLIGAERSELESTFELLDREIGAMRRFEGIGPGLKMVLKARGDGYRLSLLENALEMNGILLQHHLGSEMDSFNTVTSLVMRTYVNAEFPPSLEDLLRGV